MFENWLGELQKFMTSAYFGIGALIAIFIIGFIFFHYRIIRIKKISLSERTVKNKEVLGIDEMQQSMLHLSGMQKNVKWGNYNFLVMYRNRVLYHSFNRIRAKLSEVRKEFINYMNTNKE